MEEKEYKGKYQQKCDASICKNCKKSYKSLLQHLGKQAKCKMAYSDTDIEEVKAKVKGLSDHKEQIRKKEYYQANKEKIKEYYQANKEKIKEKRETYVRNVIDKKPYDERYSESRQKKVKEWYQQNKERLAGIRDLKLQASASQNVQKDGKIHEDPLHNCKLCTRVFKKQGNLLKHIQEEHSNYPEDDVTEPENESK